MTHIDADGKYFQKLNEEIRAASDPEVAVTNCMGQRYIGAGLSGKHILVEGVPGNDLGCYLNGAAIRVKGNAQDQTGDTMNEGTIVVEGSSGDATGYSMRGGKIMIRDGVGYRAGIHMKAYGSHQPAIVVGGEAGSFLGEYQAGGTIVVLGLGSKRKAPVGNRICAGMHGGKMFLRCEELPADLPAQVTGVRADEKDMARIDGLLREFCETFGVEMKEILAKPFYRITPDTKNPYQALYTFN